MAPRRRRSPSPGRPERPETCVVAYRIRISGNMEYIAMRAVTRGRSRSGRAERSGKRLTEFLRHPKRCYILRRGLPCMLDITKDIQSLTTFRRRSGDFMKHLRKSKRPVVLTVKGKAEAIVQAAGAYQRLLDIAARADTHEGSRQGVEQSKQGQGRDAEEFFAAFEAAHGISN